MQGLLLSNLEDIPKKFIKWKIYFKKWNTWIKTKGYSKLEVCLNYSNSFPLIKRIIFGAEDLDQLKEILSLSNNKKFLIPNNIKTNNEYLINPSKW